MWINQSTTNSIPIWGTSIMPMAGTSGVTTLQHPVFAGPKIQFRKKSRFMKALSDCPYGVCKDAFQASLMDSYFRHQTLDGFLPHMHFNPLYNGRPRKEVLPLLLCAPTPMKFFQQHLYFSYGLVTLEPAICNRRRARARLSYAGLTLLDYWAKNFPAFKPFVMAYIPKKARKEISADAVGYALGIVPPRFKKMKELHEKEIALNRDTPSRRSYFRKVERKRQELLAQQAAYYDQMNQSSVVPLWAQQQYNNTLAQQQAMLAYNTTAQQPMSVLGGTGATDATTARSNLGSALAKLIGRK